MAVDQGDRGARVRVEVLDRVDAELRVDHHHHGANFECAEQRRHEFRPVGQRDDNALLRFHSGADQEMSEAVGERLHLTIGERAMIGQQRRPAAPAFADARVQQPISDV